MTMKTFADNAKERVEIRYHVTHNQDRTITVSREEVTYPKSGRGTQWSKKAREERELFTVPADEIPDLIARAATGLSFPADGSYL